MGNYLVNRRYLPEPEPEPELPEYEYPFYSYKDTLLAHQPFEIGSAGLNIYTVKKRKPDPRCVPGTVKWKLKATELIYLGMFHNPNMVDIVGRHVNENGIPYLVNNFVPNGNLRQHLDGDYGLLSWDARERICIGVAEEIGHHHRTSPLINWDHLKSEHILLGLDYNPKISISTLPTTDNSPGSLRQDVYGVGVVFLEIITGLKAIDNTRPVELQKLEDWVSYCIRDIHDIDEWDSNVKGKLQAVIDHRLQGKYSNRALTIFMLGLRSAVIDKERRQFMSRVIEFMRDAHEEIREKFVINSSITLVHNLDLMTIR